MGKNLGIEIEDGKAYLKTPYNPDFARRIKTLGGRWDSSSRRWFVNEQSVESARKVMREVYGEDDQEEDAKVTVVATFDEEQSAMCDSYWMFGKSIARAFNRDKGAQVGEEAAFVEGSPLSGGSVKYWKTIIPAGSVVEIYNVPRKLAEQEIENGKAASKGIRLEIKESSCKIDREALKAEREQLLIRVAEIDKLLNE